MIAADTSALVAYLTGAGGEESELVGAAMASGTLVLPPVVVTEILSDPKSGEMLDAEIPLLDILEVMDGYWVRAARTRRALLAKGLKSKVADSLVAQSCIDHDVELVTRDRDFRHFAKYCGLRLASGSYRN